jgi:hypothetical protein
MSVRPGVRVREVRNEREHRIYVRDSSGNLIGYVDVRANATVVSDASRREVVVEAVASHLRDVRAGSVRRRPAQVATDIEWAVRLDPARPTSLVRARPRSIPKQVRGPGKGAARLWETRRQLATLGLLVFLVFGPAILQSIGALPARVPTARDNARVGWTTAESNAHIARDIFDRVNDERRARGAPPLVWHEGLAQRAAAWTLQMISTGEYEHSPPEFRAHPEFSGTGENILYGNRGATAAHVAWMESDGHRQAILMPGFDAVGIAVICRNDGRMWATQIFGVRQDRTSPRARVPDGPEPIVRTDPGPTCGGWGSFP